MKNQDGCAIPALVISMIAMVTSIYVAFHNPDTITLFNFIVDRLP